MIPSDFYPRPPRGGRPRLPRPCGRRSRHFYPRPPRGGRLLRIDTFSRGGCISIHALREEGDPRILPRSQTVKYFYPRPPRGGRLSVLDTSVTATVFLSTPSARRATFERNKSGARCQKFLSTPSARRATVCKSGRTSNSQISIHALREEGDYQRAVEDMRKADFYPRPPRGGRRVFYR